MTLNRLETSVPKFSRVLTEFLTGFAVCFGSVPTLQNVNRYVKRLFRSLSLNGKTLTELYKNMTDFSRLGSRFVLIALPHCKMSSWCRASV